jgi:hypothetical protein
MKEVMIAVVQPRVMGPACNGTEVMMTTTRTLLLYTLTKKTKKTKKTIRWKVGYCIWQVVDFDGGGGPARRVFVGLCSLMPWLS